MSYRRVNMKVKSDFLNLKSNDCFFLEFESAIEGVEGINAILTISSQLIGHDIRLFKVPVCADFIYKYAKMQISSTDKLLKEIIFGNHFDYIAECLNSYFHGIDDFIANIFTIRWDSAVKSLQFAVRFQSNLKYIDFDINDMDEESEEYWFSYYEFESIFLGVNKKNIDDAIYEKKLDQLSGPFSDGDNLF